MIWPTSPEVCRHLEVDPWAGHICLMGWTDHQTGEMSHRPTLTVAGRRFRAQRTGHLRGIEGPMWCGPRGYTAEGSRPPPLQWTELWDQEQVPYAARCLVFRDDWDRPANGTVSGPSREDLPAEGGGDRRPTRTWAQMPSHMLGRQRDPSRCRAFAEVAAAVAYVGDDDTAMATEVEAEVATTIPAEVTGPEAEGLENIPRNGPGAPGSGRGPGSAPYALPDSYRAGFRSWPESPSTIHRRPEVTDPEVPQGSWLETVDQLVSRRRRRRGRPSGPIHCDRASPPVVAPASPGRRSPAGIYDWRERDPDLRHNGGHVRVVRHD